MYARRVALSAARARKLLLGFDKGLQASTLANYAQARRWCADRTMRPLWRNFVGSMATLVPPPPGARLWYDDRDIPFLKDDESDMANVMLTKAGAKFTRVPYDKMIFHAAEALAQEKAVGWMQGRMEFGPRSLGARSILGDARSPTMQKTLNLKVKYRESFRPFAPAVLREDVDKYFDIDTDSPYMLMVAPVKEERRRTMTEEEQKLFGIDKLNVPRSDIPAVTHIDYSGRVQTVHKETNPAFHDLISSYKGKTGCSGVVARNR